MTRDKDATDRSAIAQRLALDALAYPVPARANRLDFMLGALTLVSLTVLAFTGIVLTQFDNPSPLDAHGSVRYVITNAPLVSYLRDVHVWSAAGAVVLVFAHLSAVFWRRGFRRPPAPHRAGSRRRVDSSPVAWPGTNV